MDHDLFMIREKLLVRKINNHVGDRFRRHRFSSCGWSLRLETLVELVHHTEELTQPLDSGT